MVLTSEIKAQLNKYLVNLKSKVVIEAFVAEDEVSTNMSDLLIELAEMSEEISLNTHKDKNERTPSFKINKPNEITGIQFAGIPMGHEFSSLVLALLQVGDHPLKISEDLIEQILLKRVHINHHVYSCVACESMGLSQSDLRANQELSVFTLSVKIFFLIYN